MVDRYPWIATVTQARALPPGRPRRPGRRAGRVFIDEPCPGCGWSPVGWRKRCPACLAPVPR
jgi:hypothetical protein